MARELKGLAAGLIAGLGVVGAAFGVSAVASHGPLAQATTKTVREQASAPAPDKSAPDKSAPDKSAPDKSQLVATGRSLYLEACAGCHGKDAEGKMGPTLQHLGDPDARIAGSIKNGFKGRMPGFKDQYTDAQISALVAYIQSLN